MPGRDIMVQGWYQGGVSVFDFTDSTNPVEIAYFDRGPLDAKNLIIGGYWSAYWYNGNIYGAEIARGIDIFRLVPSEYLIAERDRRGHPGARRPSSTRRTSRRSSGRPTSIVAKAYLDQLSRTKAIDAERAKAVRDSAREGRRAAHRQGARRRRRGSTRSTAVAAQVRSRCEDEDRPRRDAAATRWPKR